MKIYLGMNEGRRDIFRSEGTPTPGTHGATYAAVVGPFRTLRGARFMRDFGQGNPHCLCVDHAERLGKRIESEAKAIAAKY